MKQQRPKKFRFKRFEVSDEVSAMKIGTDGVLLGAWAFNGLSPMRILDVGTGTGLIALMIAQRFPDAQITGIEIDAAAAGEARHNVAESPWSTRISIMTGDFLNMSLEADAIVCNPPFFSTGELSPTPSRALARHEGALTVEALLRHVADTLKPGGHLAIIVPAEREDDIIYRATTLHLDPERVTLVAPSEGAPAIRVLLQMTKGLSTSFTRDSLVLRQSDGTHTPAYQQLTGDFYLDNINQQHD